MAKALLGHVGSPVDLRLAAEVRRLQRRVKELEAELAETQGDPGLDTESDLLTLAPPEPAYS